MYLGGEDAMDHDELAASDPRVRAILTDPDAYFSTARRLAWPEAGADIRAALGNGTGARRDGRPCSLEVLRLLPNLIHRTGRRAGSAVR